MREIKFRVWCKVDKCWKHPVYDITDMFPTYKYYHIMQYTGLKDKNGKEIYEGDILNHKPYDIIKKVIYKEASFMLNTNLGDAVMWNENTNHLEIIGNIHENPELIN